jgi:hypothetical protein
LQWAKRSGVSCSENMKEAKEPATKVWLESRDGAVEPLRSVAAKEWGEGASTRRLTGTTPGRGTRWPAPRTNWYRRASAPVGCASGLG